MKILGVDHIGIVTDNIEKSAEFYSEVLNFKNKKTFEFNDIRYAYYGDDNTTIEFLEPKNCSNVRLGITHAAYRCTDIDKYKEVFVSRGIKIANNMVNEYDGMKYIFAEIGKNNYVELVEYQEK